MCIIERLFIVMCFFFYLIFITRRCGGGVVVGVDLHFILYCLYVEVHVNYNIPHEGIKSFSVPSESYMARCNSSSTKLHAMKWFPLSRVHATQWFPCCRCKCLLPDVNFHFYEVNYVVNLLITCHRVWLTNNTYFWWQWRWCMNSPIEKS